MIIEYRLTGKGQGIFLKRVSELLNGGTEIKFVFHNATPNSTVVFKSKDKPFYRTLNESGECSINTDLLEGVVDITVFTSNHTKLWHCEKLYISKKNDIVMVVAADIDLIDSITTLKLLYHELYVKAISLESKCDKLDSKLTEILEGYDII